VNARRVASVDRSNAPLKGPNGDTTNGLTHFSRWSAEVILLQTPSPMINNSVAPVDPADITP
jgi:hypothetical protein